MEGAAQRNQLGERQKDDVAIRKCNSFCCVTSVTDAIDTKHVAFHREIQDLFIAVRVKMYRF